MFLVRGVDLLTPLARLLIQILPTGETAPRQKVILNEMEGPFHSSRTIRIPDRVRHELKPETLSECRHLRHGNHVASAAPQHHYVRVIDHHARCGPTRSEERR